MLTLIQSIRLMEKINFEEGDRFNCFFENGKMIIESKIIEFGINYNGK